MPFNFFSVSKLWQKKPEFFCQYEKRTESDVKNNGKDIYKKEKYRIKSPRATR